MPNEVKVGILEYGVVDFAKESAVRTINNLFEDISLYEEMGYHRLWLTEHFSPLYAWLNPEMLLPLLAGYSERIRVGMAGVLLSYHKPLLVAQNFKLLSAVYNDRIDLGIARASVPETVSSYLISSEEKNNSAVEWETRVEHLCSFLRETDYRISLIPELLVPPQNITLPQLWMLGTSGFSTQIAIKNKLNFCFSFLYANDKLDEVIGIVQKFKEDFFKKHDVKPLTALLLCCNCPNVDADNNRIFNPLFTLDSNNSDDVLITQLTKIKRLFKNDEFIIYSASHDRTIRNRDYARVINLIKTC